MLSSRRDLLATYLKKKKLYSYCLQFTYNLEIRRRDAMCVSVCVCVCVCECVCGPLFPDGSIDPSPPPPGCNGWLNCCLACDQLLQQSNPPPPLNTYNLYQHILFLDMHMEPYTRNIHIKIFWLLTQLILKKNGS